MKQKFTFLLLSLPLVLSGCQNISSSFSSSLSSSFEESSLLSSDETTSDSTLSSSSTSSSLSSTNSSSSSPVIPEDPYVGIDTKAERDQFYEDYEPAKDYWDSHYRSLHFLMSGSIAEQSDEPTIAPDQPMEGSLLVKNTSSLFSEDGNAYTVLDSQGEVAFEIYRGGAYVALEEVAAYVQAFKDVPVNYNEDKNDRNPKTSPWGKYLRVNHSAFEGDTDKYPYEPSLPDIYGNGGKTRYYELDIGTTGSGYSGEYNDGYSIDRGAARIVYARSRIDGKPLEESFVFYTNNHYNDFWEYLNYENGWGERFGNETGGGKLDSETDCNPTPYVDVAMEDFSK